MAPWGSPEPPTFEVVGVVGDVLYSDLREPAPETLYFDSRGWSWTDWELHLLVRTEAGAQAASEDLVPQIRSELAALDPQVPLARPSSMDRYLQQQLAPTRFALSLIGLFAAVAALLACLGLYGVTAYAVSRRRREIGIRMALGARRGWILRWILGQGLRLTLVGIACGLVGALALTRFLASLLFEVAPTDPASLGAVALLLAAIALAACLLPAHRATRVHPIEVLRSE